MYWYVIVTPPFLYWKHILYLHDILNWIKLYMNSTVVSANSNSLFTDKYTTVMNSDKLNKIVHTFYCCGGCLSSLLQYTCRWIGNLRQPLFLIYLICYYLISYAQDRRFSTKPAVREPSYSLLYLINWAEICIMEQ